MDSLSRLQNKGCPDETSPLPLLAPARLVVVYQPPSSWPTNNRTRGFIPLSRRCYSRETDLGILRRSVQLLVTKQDARGSFYSDKEYCMGDRIDDQLAGAAMVACYLGIEGPDPVLNRVLERAVRFHLERLVCGSATQPFRYSPYVLDRDTDSWCNTLWCLWGAALVFRHGRGYLTDSTAEELSDLMGDYWGFVSNFPTRDENPCHNQLVAYCHIGHLYASVSGERAVASEVTHYYRHVLRGLRVRDRGYFIFSEFNQWDTHYALVTWMALEALAAETGDPIYRQDAEVMASYFNERVSAGGYVWGGSRQNEPGLDEFVHLPFSRHIDLGLDRLLLPEPSPLWDHLAMPSHEGRTLITRLEMPPRVREAGPDAEPTTWHFRRGAASVCLRDDFQLLHVSSAGLELIPSADPLEMGFGLTWRNGATWKKDSLQFHGPRASDGHRYADSKVVRLDGVAGLATTQRGFIWETRQWWLAAGENNLVWVGHLISHATPQCDELIFVLGVPVLTRAVNQPAPVTAAENAEGVRVDTQGDEVRISSPQYLRFGDVHVGGTAPVEFIRPSREAFHSFPTRKGLLRDLRSSNQLVLKVVTTPTSFDCRESVFFAVEIGRNAPAVEMDRPSPQACKLRSSTGCFEAHQVDGIWNYAFTGATGRGELPPLGFGLRKVGNSVAPV